MDYLRRRWYKIGIVLAAILSFVLVVWHKDISDFRVLLSISFIALLLHQFEEYQLPGYFPRMINTVMFRSRHPDRFPLNPNTALIINVGLGWSLYILAILFAQTAVWLAIATIVISAGNVMAHTFLFNIKGRLLYNPGMFTALVLFLPITIYFFVFLHTHDLVHPDNLAAGLVCGLLINYFGILKLITILGRKDTRYIFRPFR